MKLKIKSCFSYVLIIGIKFYQITLSWLWPKSCRFYPSCSAYGHEAIKTYGPLKGGWLTLKRLYRCRPGNRYHGYDPLPQPEKVYPHE
jgi:putative membrane protein insertion efficiency factor